MRIHRAAIDLIHPQGPGLERGNGDGRRDQHIDAPEQLHESIPELRAAMRGIHVIDTAIGPAAHDDVVIVTIGTGQHRLFAT